MATATRSPLVEQAERIDGLARHLSEGRLLEKPVRLAGSDTVWTGPISIGFKGWLVQALDFWVRNQLAEGVRLVARSLFDRAAAVEQAAQQMLATGQVTVAPPAMPAPLNYTPGTPPQYGDIGGAGTNTYNVPEMRNLSHLLLATADEVMNFARTLDLVLQPPPAPPPPPGAPPPINPLPPDTEAVVGYPQTYVEIANQLRNAAMDVAKRADLIMATEEPLPTTTIDLGIIDTAASGASAQATSSDPAADQAADAARQPAEKLPPTEEEIRVARQEGEQLAAKALDEKALEDPKKLKEIAKELGAHKNDPAAEAYAAAFAKKFGPKNMLALPRAVHSFQTGVAAEPKSAWEQATRPPPAASAEDKEDILYAFSATLATATHSDEFDQSIEDKIFDTEDKLALAWLLANPKADFDADFLVKAFEAGVMEQIKNELALTGIGAYGANTAGELELNGTKLSTDTKIVVLDAISRNKEAAMRIADLDFKPPLEVAMGLRSPQDVHNVVDLLYLGAESNNGYSDNGAALGRMLDFAHQGFVEGGDAANAKELVDRIVKDATNDKDVKAAQPYLVRIGSRQPTDAPAAQAALDRVRDDPKQPGRELLLSQMAQVRDTAKTFAEAAFTASKNNVKEIKSPELRALRQTEGAWNVIPTLAEDPATADLAQTLTEQGIREAAKGELNDEARRGLAKAITADAAGFARSVTALLSPPKGDQAKAHAPEAEGIQVTADEFAAAVADLMEDPEAKRTIEAGAGNLTGSWASQAAASHIDGVIGKEKEWDRPRKQALAQQSKELGNYLCAVIKAETMAAENKAQAAADALTGMRIGANIFSMGLDLASGFVPGGGALKAGGKFLFDKAIDTVKGGTGVEGLPLGLEGGLTGVMDDEIKSQEDAAWAKAKLEVADALPMAKEFVRDQVAGGLLQETLLRSSPDREEALAQLGVSQAAIEEAGLLTENGRVKIPLPGSADYTRYTNFLRANSSFGGAITEASEGVADNFTDCMNSALILKTTGK